MRAVRLRSSHLPALTALLAQAPVTNLFLRDLIARRGIGNWRVEEWFGAWAGDDLVSTALLVGRPALDGPARLGVAYGARGGCRVIGDRARWNGPVNMLIGPREASDGLWEGLQGPTPAVCYDQRLYICRTPPPGPQEPLRLARPDELELLVALSGEMMREDLGTDPREAEPARHRLAVKGRLDDGRTLVADVDGEIGFVLDVGTRRPEGAQVGGTYVVPRMRGRGLASRGMRAALHRLLAEHGTVSLHVNEANVPAIRCYENAGFERDVPFRLLIR